jgi:hypothetical protein
MILLVHKPKMRKLRIAQPCAQTLEHHSMPLPKRPLTDHEEDVLATLAEHLDHGLDDFDMDVVRRVQQLQQEKAGGPGAPATRSLA